jgi:flagellum-specific ATP synthase/type III secretion protein N (ATPase)
MPDVTEVDHRMKAGRVRDWMATIKENEDLISVGAYVPGSNPRVDEAFSRRDAIEQFLRQPAEQLTTVDEGIASLKGL